MPRTYGASSLESGRPLPCDQRTRMGTLPPWRWTARQRDAASGLALNVPEQNTPLACSTRWPAGASSPPRDGRWPPLDPACPDGRARSAVAHPHGAQDPDQEHGDPATTASQGSVATSTRQPVAPSTWSHRGYLRCSDPEPGRPRWRRSSRGARRTTRSRSPRAGPRGAPARPPRRRRSARRGAARGTSGARRPASAAGRPRGPWRGRYGRGPVIRASSAPAAQRGSDPDDRFGPVPGSRRPRRRRAAGWTRPGSPVRAPSGGRPRRRRTRQPRRPGQPRSRAGSLRSGWAHSLALTVVAALRGSDSQGLGDWGVPHGAYGVLQSAGLLFFAFAGYARIATLGEEVREPERVIPRAIGLPWPARLSCTPSSGSPPEGARTGRTGPRTRRWPTRWPPDLGVGRAGRSGRCGRSPRRRPARPGRRLGRTSLAMAREGDLPRWLDAVHPRYHVPHRAELTVAAVVVVLVLLVDLRGAIGFSSFGVLLYYFVANAAARAQGPEQRRYPRWLQVLGARAAWCSSRRCPGRRSWPGSPCSWSGSCCGSCGWCDCAPSPTVGPCWIQRRRSTVSRRS